MPLMASVHLADKGFFCQSFGEVLPLDIPETMQNIDKWLIKSFYKYDCVVEWALKL